MATPQKIRCVVDHIIDHGNKVYTVELIPEKPTPRFKAGQFLHLALDPYDPSGYWPESRVFSIASSPESREKLQISYSVKGRYTTRMEKELAQGSEVWIKLPYGEFIIVPSRPVVLIAGGTGLTAFTAFLDGLGENLETLVHVFYGVRDRSLLIFKEMLEAKKRLIKALQIHCFIENLDQAEINETKGQLTISEILSQIENPLGSDYYLSGPPMMLQKMTKDLQAREVPFDQIHLDAWE